MTFIYGESSRKQRDTCHPKLVAVIDLGLSISTIDISILKGRRGKEEQNKAVADGFSKVSWPNGDHNVTLKDGITEDPMGLSRAFDFGPYIQGIPWEDEGAFYKVAMCFEIAAKMLHTRIGSGTDWDRDGLTEDQTFNDLGHIYLLEGE